MDISTILSLGQTALELGLICSLTVLALFLSYTMLNVCDLSTDGCFTLGAAVGAAVALAGHPWLSLGAAMAAGLSRIRDVFRFYSRIFCFAAEEFFLPHGFGRQVPVAAGETFFRVHGSWRACPAGLFRTGASSACSGDGCFAGGGERAWRLNKKRRRRCACVISGDGSDRRKKRFFCRMVFV